MNVSMNPLRAKMNKSIRLLAILLVLGLSVQAHQAPTKAQQSPPAKSEGINDRWKSPNIEPLVATLENENREIYAHRVLLAAIVGPKPGSVVADVGAGSGFMVEEFARRVGPSGKVFAVDINAKMLELIAQRAAKDGLQNIQTVLTREDSVDLPSHSVDLVFVCDTYHHFEYPKQSLAGIYRALRPGGELVVVEFKREPGHSPAWILEHVSKGQSEVIKEIEAAGFTLSNDHTSPLLRDNYVLRFRKK
jgi:ubiquinone/menaquinone biosynthesis C-methylase UbiE